MTEISSGAQLPFYGEVPVENAASALDNYRVTDEQQQYALDLARGFVETDQTPAGLLLTGAAGNGKTHLAVGIARAVAEQGKTAAFVSFDGGLPSFDAISTIPGVPIDGWWDHISRLTESVDLLVIDDVPGTMAPGARGYLQQLVLASHEAGKKMVMTSDQQPSHLVTQIAEQHRDSVITTDKSEAVRERIAQTYQIVEFASGSFRNAQPKWWDDIKRRQYEPRSPGELQAPGSPEFARLVGSILLKIAEATGVSTDETAQLAEILAREQNT
jgi:DNA replication protein DnaC